MKRIVLFHRAVQTATFLADVSGTRNENTATFLADVSSTRNKNTAL